MKPVDSILVLDSEDGLLRTLILILKRSGFHSYAAKDVSALTSQLHSHKIDMLIINDSFFKSNQTNLLMSINLANPGLLILLLTGWLSSEVINYLQSQSRCAIIAKPIDPVDLIKVVAELLG